MDNHGNDSGVFTIADVLTRPSWMELEDEDSRSFQCLSPRSVLSRWLSSVKKMKWQKNLAKPERTKTTARRRNKRSADNGCVHRNGEVRCSKKKFTCDSPHSNSENLKEDGEEAESSESHRKKDSFNLGVGFGLLYLITVTRNGYLQMMELRTQVETILQKVKEELKSQKSDANSRASYVTDAVACSTTDAPKGSHTNEQDSLQISSQFENAANSETSMICESPNYNTTIHDKCVDRMEVLEAELEAELECLQLRLDTEFVSKNANQETLEVNVDDTAGKNYLGVSARELERRLHELQHLQRIKELESDLECAKLTLRQKDLEISRWKDNVRLLISQHAPEISHLLASDCIKL